MIRIALSMVVMVLCAATALQAQNGALEKQRRIPRAIPRARLDSLIRLLNTPGVRWDSLVGLLAEFPVRNPLLGIQLGDPEQRGSRIFAGQLRVRGYGFGVEDDYSLDVMTDGDTIVAASLREARRQILRVIDTVRLRAAFADHEKLFCTRIDFSDRWTFSFESYRFGISCGDPPGPPDQFEELVYLLGHDLTTMRRWSRSLHPEIQAYGALGLLYLQWTGEKLSEDDEAVLAVLRASSVVVHMCHDCIGYHLPMSEALNYLPLPWVMKQIKEMLERGEE